LFFIFYISQPSNKELDLAYSYKSGYFEHTDFKEGELNPIFKNIFNKTKKGNFLDIGCGTGHIVYTAKMCGWNARGIDLNKDAIEKARRKGLNTKCVNIDKFNDKSKSYDIINMGDLIEHVRAPEKTIKKASDLLKTGGKLIVSTPNINSFFPKYSFYISKILGITWSHPSLPYHLFEFSNKNFPKFLEQRGFRIDKITYSKIPLDYSIGNTGLFVKFKDEYRKNKSISKSLLRNGVINNLLLLTTLALYIPGHLISKCFSTKDQMVLICTKQNGFI